ncbi:hypothetical protein ABPG74_003805 [Tetrahymena malaccensis]
MKKTQIILITAIACFATATLFLFQKSQNFYQIKNFAYNEKIAENLSGFSLASYCSSSKIKNWNCGAPCNKNPQGVKDVYYMLNTTMDSAGFMGYSPAHDAIIVAFRGTIPWSKKNWISDINTIKIKYPRCENCYVHQGFYKAFLGLQSQIITEFPKLKAKYPNSKVFVTGHSLGAAMSTHSMPIIYQLNGNKPIDAFYNFGSPRVGDQTFHDWFSTQSFSKEYGRINHRADPVPHLPPNGAPFQFVHIDHEIFYESFSTPYLLCAQSEDPDCADGVSYPIDIPDHFSYFGYDWVAEMFTCQ